MPNDASGSGSDRHLDQPAKAEPAQDHFQRGDLYRGVASLNQSDAQGTAGGINGKNSQTLDFDKAGDIYSGAHSPGMGGGARGGADSGSSAKGRAGGGANHELSSMAPGGAGGPSSHDGSEAKGGSAAHAGSETHPGSEAHGGKDGGAASPHHLSEAGMSGGIASEAGGTRANADGKGSVGTDGASRSDAGSSDFSPGADVGASVVSDKSADAKSEAGSGGDAGAGASRHVPFDASTAKYDASQIYDLNASQRMELPVETINKVNQNNVTNLEQRAQDLGNDMPNVALRGAQGQYTEREEAQAAGDKGSILHYAVSVKPPTDPSSKLADLAGNFSKATSYAKGDDPKIYAFAHDREADKSGTYFTKNTPPTGPEPFKPTTNTGEIHKEFAPGVMQHLTTLHKDDVYSAERMTAMPNDRFKALEADHTVKALDKIMTAIEAQHPEKVQAAQAERQAQREASARAAEQQGVWSRLSNSVKSWF
jgi:hypothetical protein